MGSGLEWRGRDYSVDHTNSAVSHLLGVFHIDFYLAFGMLTEHQKEVRSPGSTEKEVACHVTRD